MQEKGRVEDLLSGCCRILLFLGLFKMNILDKKFIYFFFIQRVFENGVVRWYGFQQSVGKLDRGQWEFELKLLFKSYFFQGI